MGTRKVAKGGAKGAVKAVETCEKTVLECWASKDAFLKREEVVRLPSLRITDGEKVVADFDDYGKLYAWSNGRHGRGYNMTAFVTGCAELILLFGECPLRYDVRTTKLERIEVAKGKDEVRGVWTEVRLGSVGK